MNRCLIRHGDNKLGRTSINGNLRFLQLLLCNNLFIGKVFISRDASQFNPILWDSGIFNNQLFFCALKYNNFSLVSHSQDHCFLDCNFHHHDVRSTFFLIFLILLACGDVQLNPGPKNKFDINFSICHWNLNSKVAHNYARVFLLKAYMAVYKFDIICISETYLGTSITSDNGNLDFNFNLRL